MPELPHPPSLGPARLPVSRRRAVWRQVVWRLVARGVRLALAATVLAAVGIVAAPAAQACACGAMVAEDLSVRGEVALITWDGRTERIDMVLQTQGDAEEAAWIMPAPPGTELGLGSQDIFEDLADETRPRPVYVDDWTLRITGLDGSDTSGTEEGGGPSVRTTEIGPFEVSTLSGGDAASVGAWLTANGFPAREDLYPTYQSYIDQGWDILATRLTAEGADGFAHDLEPLRLTFATDEPVYPIRLSHHAVESQDLTLYLAADTTLEVAQEASSTPLGLTYAGTIDAGLVDPGATGELRLTKLEASLDPAAITDDYTFRTAANQDDYHETYEIVRHKLDIPWQIAVGAGFVLVAAIISGVVLVRATRPKPAATPTDTTTDTATDDRPHDPEA